MICAKCNKKKQASRKDPAFCQQCYNNTLMDRTQASVRLLNNSVTDDVGGHSQSIYAFMSLFHPELSHSQKMKIAKRD